MATSPEQAIESMLANYPEKTGKPFDAWLKLAKKRIKAQGPQKHGQLVQWLKGDHAMGHGYANMVALRALQGDGPAPDGGALIDAQYAGAKAGLRPLHDALVAHAKRLGRDVVISPKKTSVSLRRSRQFALITAASATRIDLGLNLKGVAPAGRLEKSPSAMCTHRVRVATKADLDAELLRWLAQAYAGA